MWDGYPYPVETTHNCLRTGLMRFVVLKVFAIVLLLFGLSGLLVIFPDIGKVTGDPQRISVADLATRRPTDNILVHITDFDYGSHPVTKPTPGSVAFSKVFLVLFPKGKADDVQAPTVILVVPNVTNAQQLKEFCKASDLLGVVQSGERTDVARKAVADSYPGMKTDSTPVVKFDENYGLIYYFTFGALFLSLLTFGIVRLRPWMDETEKKLKARAQAQNEAGLPAKKTIVLTPTASRAYGLASIVVGLVIAQFYDSTIVDAAQHNKDVWLVFYIFLVGPALVAFGLFNLVQARPPANKKETNIVLGVFLLITAVLFFLLNNQLKQYGTSFL
jgi:hypothetical protein